MKGTLPTVQNMERLTRNIIHAMGYTVKLRFALNSYNPLTDKCKG